MELIRLVVNAIGTLLYMCCRSFSSSSSVADSVVADSAVADSVDSVVADSAVADSVVADSVVADSAVADSAVADSVVADSAAVADDDDADIPPCQEKYDVFISFRGEDTRRTFTSHLHAALFQKKIETYIDYKLQRGEEIGPALLEAIEKSTISVIIFSQNYASSTWCLDELVHILKCKERYGHMVIPIFYDTLPSDVRKQRGSYALDLLEQRFENSNDKVRNWRDALTNAANMCGFDSKYYGKEADLVKDVVEDIWTKLCRESSCDLEGLVGIGSRIEQIESLLDIHSQDARITVGIWGMGGIGKTTLAETVFHRLSSKFEGSCFLRNVTEREQKDGLDHLQKTLLKEILNEEGVSIGSTSVRERLRKTKVLIVLDDVSSSMQMEHLAGNLLRYDTGSRIIFTSRDRSTLGQAVEEGRIYPIGGLKWDDALQLFCSRAFKNNSTCRTDYMGLAIKAVDYAGGVPLALILLGSSFRNCKSKEAWEEELKKLKEFPNENIQRVLRLSYDGLGRYEKEIFLDVACFHKGRDVDEVEKMLVIRGRYAATGIRVLIDMSLISIHSKWGRQTIEMHDLLEEMGRIIVLEQCIEDPCKGNRLFKDEDVYRVLKSNKETPNVEAILVNWSKIQEQPLKSADIKKMSNLRLLIVDNFYESGNWWEFTASLDLPDSLCYLYWPYYPLESLPSNFSSENLLGLHMPNGKVKKLWEEDQILVNLEFIDLHNSHYLIEAPNLSGSLKIVNINLSGCAHLVEIPECFQHLHKLTHLRLGHCTSLKYLPEMPESIKYLDLQSSGIKELPESVWSNENISYLNISHCKDLEKLPSNSCELKVSNVLGIESCTSLGEFSELPRDITKLSLVGFKRLVSLPTHICKLKYLEELNLSGCSGLEKFPEILEPMEHLVSLSLQGTAVEMLPSSIGNLISLQTLDLSGCDNLENVPTSIYSLSLTHLYLGGCISLRYLPKMPGSIKYLDLHSSGIRELPESVWSNENISYLNMSHCKDLEKLPSNRCKLKVSGCFNLDGCTYFGEFFELPRNISKLSLADCKRLVSLPTNICKLTYLEELNLSGCSELENFPEILEPMEHLVSLSLQGTAVERLPSSIGNLIRLQTLCLSGCKHLKDVLTSLDLYACPEFKKLPSGSLGSLSLKGFVGIESCIKRIESLLYIHSQDTCLSVGIWGMGGIGKTTLAEAIFHRLSSKFEACCFLRNVREREQKDGLEHLQSTLISKILKEEGLSIRSTSVHERLSHTKVLIVLDDVSDSRQVQCLAGKRLRYGTGSRLIITRRTTGTFRPNVEEDKIYEVGRLKPDDALQLFCSHAFKNNGAHRTDFKELAEKVVDYAGGVPLALKLLGSSFFNCKSKEEWEEEFNKLREFPNGNIEGVLRLSYDGLGRNEKEIFLDIACFHKGENVNKVKQLLDVRGFRATDGIRILIDMSLISIYSRWGRETIEMHDLPEEIGRVIGREQCLGDPGRRSRLFNDWAVYHVLKSNTETPMVGAIRVNWSKIEEQSLKHANFKKMSNLRLLIVDDGYELNASLDLPDSLCYLYWKGYPLESLPSNFCPEYLVELHMPDSKVKKLLKEDQRLVNLQVIDLHDSTNLTEVPNLSWSLKIMNINLSGCESLVEIPEGLVCSTSLERINLSGTKIRSIPASIKQASRLSELNLVGCKQLQSLPELPVLCNVRAQGCTALKTEVSSRTAFTCASKK